MARIKLDLTADEMLVLRSTLCEVRNPYSDKPQAGIKANCYSFYEIFAEKIRALSERARPRDLCDVIHLFRYVSTDIESASIFDVLKRKCEYKAIAVLTLKHIESHPRRHQLETEWANMLGHQLPMLPPFEQFWQELPSSFDWLHGVASKVVQIPVPLPSREAIDNSWRPPSMIQLWNMSAPLELVRYAGANHLCIELIYDDKKCLVEPYDLKRTQKGKLLLIVIKHNAGEWRSYHVDKIQVIKVANISFAPKYMISLTTYSEIV